MSRFAMMVNLELAPARVDEYIPLLKAHRARCLQTEPGTLQIDILRPLDDPGKVMIFVIYRDEEAATAHANGASRARHYKEAEGILLGASGTKFTVLD